MTDQYIRLLKRIDNINKQLSHGKRKYSVKKHIQAKQRNNYDIYGEMKEKKYKNDSQYCFLLDNTGSMGGSNMRLQNKMLVNMLTALERLNKRFSIHGFTSREEAYTPSPEPVIHHEFVPINSMLTKQRVNKDKLVTKVNSVYSGAQREFVNIQLLYDDILEYKKKNNKSNRVNIVMFSDGGCTGQEHLLNSVISNINRNADKTNVYLYIFNIYNNDMSVYGKISSEITDEKSMLKAFTKLIRVGEV